MCGICGIASSDRPFDPLALARMTAALQHRGPDNAGFYSSRPTSGASIGLGFRRLSIIDLKTGNQPISNEDASIWIVFNGEIYNFAELRRDLIARGHTFSTQSDTETIVHLYEELGSACVERLNGMFALALWDERRQELLLARDRFGKKPLYYAATTDGFLFGSELKSLLQHPSCPLEIDHASLAAYLALEYVPEPRSILAGVSKLPAAHTLIWRSGAVHLRRYWELPFSPDHSMTAAAAAEEFRERLRAAVERRLISDVPLGAFLSGGVDSSSVVSMMAELLPSKNVKTFSIGFTEASFDESSHARRVAAFFGTDHREDVFTSDTLLDLLPEVTDWLDEPFADPSVIPTYLLSRFTREHVTVALGGDGGDELLAGYPTFAAERLARFYRIPSLLHEQVVVRLIDRLPVSTRNFSTDFKLKRFVRGMSYPLQQRHIAWLGAFAPDDVASVLHAGDENLPGSLPSIADDAERSDPIARLIAYYVASYLRDDILVKVDRASMAASLEVRAPFLDVELAEFLGRVPSRLKLRGLRTKYLLKRAMGRHLPPGIARRAKKGFGIPVAQWLNTGLCDLLREELSLPRLEAQGLFDAAVVQQLVDEHASGRRDHRKELWTLLMFQLWQRRLDEGRWTRPIEFDERLDPLTQA